MKQKLLYVILQLFFPFILLTAQTNYNLSNLTNFDGEPYIAVNPANQNNIIAGWMRLRADGKIWIATKASFDKGLTWSQINYLPHDTIINGSADISIAFHHSGIAYASWINFRQSPDTTGAVFVSKSVDGGLTWGSPTKVIGSDDLPDFPFDRPWIAVDNSGGWNDGALYLTSMTAYWVLGQHHIYLKTSTDGGLSWSSIKPIDTATFSVGSLTSCYGGISIGSNGRAYIAYLSYDVIASPYPRYYCITTTDLGMSFQRNIIGNAFIGSGAGFTKGWNISANPVLNGHAALTWVDNRNGDYDILLSKTNDGGFTWSAPIRVNDDELNNGIEQDMVWASFSPSGKYVVAWRDRRLNGVGSTVPFDMYCSISSDTLNSFSPNYRVTTVSNPYFLVSKGNSFIGCSMSDSCVFLNWGDYRNSPDWDIYYNMTNNSAFINNVNDLDKYNPFKIALFPSLADRTICVSLCYPPNSTLTSLIIFNSLGQIMKKMKIKETPSNKFVQTIDVSDLSAGVYHVYIKINQSYFRNITFIKK